MIQRRQALSLLTIGGLAACAEKPVQPVVAVVPPPAPPRPTERLLYCVPYARERSGIQLAGDGWEWWEAATGKYHRGPKPEAGAILVFNKSNRLAVGHVSVVTRVVSDRELRVDHANWENRGGGGPIFLDQQVIDVSSGNDWSAVRVWWPAANSLGLTVFPTLGFVYNRPVSPAATTT